MTVPTEGGGHGGRRLGTPGRGYAQRTDLNVNRAATPAGTPAPSPTVEPGMAGLTPPDATPNLTDPSADQRPITHGLNIGPGAGAEALVAPPQINTDHTLAILHLLYEKTGSDYLRRLMIRKEGLDRAMMRQPAPGGGQ